MNGVRKVAKFTSENVSKLDRHINYLTNNKMNFTVTCAKKMTGVYEFTIVWWDGSGS